MDREGPVIPLYGFLEGDTLGLLVLASPRDTMAELASKLMSAAAVRVGPKTRPVVMFAGEVVPSGRTVTAAGMSALDRFDVVEEKT
jgi:hypothetical protein